MKTTTICHASPTLLRLRALLKQAGHRLPSSARARLNLADIRDRRATAARRERTLATHAHRQMAESFVWEIDWRVELAAHS